MRVCVLPQPGLLARPAERVGAGQHVPALPSRHLLQRVCGGLVRALLRGSRAVALRGNHLPPVRGTITIAIAMHAHCLAQHQSLPREAHP